MVLARHHDNFRDKAVNCVGQGEARRSCYSKQPYYDYLCDSITLWTYPTAKAELIPYALPAASGDSKT